VLRVAIACVLLGVACTSRVDDPPGPAYDSWDEACTIWEWIASRTMEATDEVAIAELVTELRARCDFYEHVAPPECTEVVWDLLACQEPLPRPYTCCSAGAPCEAEFEAAQFEPGDPCAPP
jgi:hypothetical protein